MAQASLSTGTRSHLLPDAYGPERSTVTLSGVCQIGISKANGLSDGKQFD
jgi:hypothetical protein